MSVLSQTILWCVVQLAVISCATVLLARFAGRRNPAAGVWCLRTGITLSLVITLLAPTALPSWFSILSTHEATAVASSEAETPTKHIVPPTTTTPSELDTSTTLDSSESEFATNPLWTNLQTTFDKLSTAAAVTPERKASTPAKESWSPLTWTVIVGAAMGTVWFLVGLGSVQLLLRGSELIVDPRVTETLDIVVAELSCTRSVRLVETERIASAATVGFFRPVVLLPSSWYGWTDQELHAVIAHEIAHVRANDFAATVLGQLVVAIHFFHPFIHYLSRQLRITQELAADATASTLAGGRTDYATVLAGMALRTNSQSNLWATQAFLPAPRTLLRRIEMLRDATTLRTGLSRPARVFLTSAMVLTVCAAAGLRANPIAAEAPEPREPVPIATNRSGNLTQESKPLSLDWIPNGSMAVFAFKPNEFLNHEVGKPLAKTATEQLAGSGIDIDEIDSITICQVHPSKTERSISRLRSNRSERPRLAIGNFWVLRNRVKTDWKKVQKGASGIVVDDFTFILVQDSAVKELIETTGKQGTSNRFWHEQWKLLKEQPAAAIFDIGALREFDPDAARQILGQAMFEATSPIWGAGELLSVSLTPAEAVQLKATMTSASEGHGEEIAATTKAAVTLVRNMLMNQERSLARSPLPDVALMADFVGIIGSGLKDAKVRQQGADTMLQVDLPSDQMAAMVERMVPLMAGASARMGEAQRKNNLKQVALAMHNYHSVYGHFPPAYSMGKDGNGKHPVSWRVMLTPFLERSDIFDNYHFGEPFDSLHNRKVTMKMPAVFARPGGGAESLKTAIFAVVSTDPKRPTGFGRHQGKRIRDFQDGTSNSLLLVEAKRDVHWAKPEDVEWNPADPLPGLNGFGGDALLSARADASVDSFNPKLAPQEFQYMLTITDGQIVDQSQLQPRR